MKSKDKLLVKAEKVIRATCELSRENINYLRLYNEITAEKDSERAVALWRTRCRKNGDRGRSGTANRERDSS